MERGGEGERERGGLVQKLLSRDVTHTVSQMYMEWVCNFRTFSVKVYAHSETDFCILEGCIVLTSHWKCRASQNVSDSASNCGRT
jgi:hypothetical protein